MSDIAIVVGASSGLGMEIARLLPARGIDVVGVARRGPDVRGDASDRRTAQAAIDEAKRRGSLKILVNCAGVGIYKPAGTYDAADVDATLSSNLVAMVTFCEAVYPLFRDNGGTIVNVMSTAALTGKSGETIYCAAKWGARGYTEALRAEAKGTKARVISVFPGGMKTPFWPDPTRSATFMDPKEVAAAIVEAIFQPPTIQVSEIIINRP